MGMSFSSAAGPFLLSYHERDTEGKLKELGKKESQEELEEGSQQCTIPFCLGIFGITAFLQLPSSHRILNKLPRKWAKKHEQLKWIFFPQNFLIFPLECQDRERLGQLGFCSIPSSWSNKSRRTLWVCGGIFVYSQRIFVYGGWGGISVYSQ